MEEWVQILQVEVQRVLGPERRVSRLEREEQLVQKAMRKKSRKVGTVCSATTNFVYQVSREGDFLVFVEKQGLLTTQNGTQQIIERRVRLGGTDLNTLEELGF